MQQCARCKEMFDETMNIGRWNCHQHRYGFPVMGMWPCCDTKEYQEGCVLSDHSALCGHVFVEADDIYVDNDTITEMSRLGIFFSRF